MALIKCTECGQEISDMATACPKCGRPTGVVVKTKSPSVTAILNFFFWFLGYFYLGEYSLGIIFLLIFISGVIDMFNPPSNINILILGYIIGLFLSLLLANDGYKRTKRYNEAQFKK
jgi:DNA-directed RNA polymerase subunit RPC12/RpoP